MGNFARIGTWDGACLEIGSLAINPNFAEGNPHKKEEGVYADISGSEMMIGKFGKANGLLILLAGVLAVYVYFFSYLGSDYSPYYGDEYFYYKNSEAFYLTNSLKASFTYSGNGARVLGADAHGPAYPLLYGSIAKVLGWGGLTIPIINGGILILALLVLLWNKETTRQTKSLQCLLLLGSPITLFYSITYLPELLQIAGAIGLYLLLQRYLLSNSRRNFLILVLYILILGSIRSTWFFAFFGLIVLPGPVRGYYKTIYLIIGLAFPFLFQHLFHEQVPNVFSSLGETLKNDDYLSAFNNVYENFIQNICFAITYADGDFYAVQKVWIFTTFLFSITIFRKDKLILSGLAILGSTMLFTLILYKNYTWIDLRMYTPMTFFLNLRIISKFQIKYQIVVLMTINFCSFILILPLQQVIVKYRVPSRNFIIPEKTLNDLKNLEAPLIYIDTGTLFNYKIIDLPIMDISSNPIIYILPYYDMPSENPSHFLVEETDHWCVKSINIRSQKIIPSTDCKQ